MVDSLIRIRPKSFVVGLAKKSTFGEAIVFEDLLELRSFDWVGVRTLWVQ